MRITSSLMFSKLLNSMGSVSELRFLRCGILFKEDFKINENRRYSFSYVEILTGGFYESTFKKFMKFLSHASKSTKFKLNIEQITVKTENTEFELSLQRLNMPYIRLRPGWIRISHFECSSSFLMNSVKF